MSLNSCGESSGASDDENALPAPPPNYSVVLLDQHLSLARAHPGLYSPALVLAITSQCMHPGEPPPHPHQTHHVVRSSGGGTYYGELDPKRRKSGYGHMVYDDGDVFQGHWFKDDAEGIGCYFWADTGSVYFGDWKGGQRHGQGEFAFGPRRSDVLLPAVYSGEWKNNRVRCPGRLQFIERSVLAVEELEDEKNRKSLTRDTFKSMLFGSTRRV